MHARDISNAEDLNFQQKQCVENLHGFMLVLSGAGTGKTRIIVKRFLKLVENNVDPKKIICVTFSNKAANEIFKRIAQQMEDVEGLWVGTFHKICFRLLQKYGNLPSNISIIDEEDQKKICARLDITEFLKNIQLFKEQLPVDENHAFQLAYNTYQNFLRANNLMDFGEIIRRTTDLLETNPNLRDFIREKFDYIMVDEYQDTSKLQNYLIKLLSRENLCCVGDDDQSIYGWRGACVQNILQFKENFPGAKTFRLEQNYRSTKEILSVANYLVHQNFNRMQKEIWTDNTGEKVKIFCSRHETDLIAQEIRNLPPNENVGILVRASTLIKPIEISLLKYDVAYKIMGGMRFFEKLEIKTALAYLKVVFFEDILSIERVLTIPKRKIGPKKIERLLEQIQNGLSFSSALREIGHGELLDQILQWKNLINLRKKNSDILKTIWLESGCEELFADREENFAILLDKIDEYRTIPDFLENFFAIDTDESSRVTIMTIHSSKGLEFDNVFIPGLVEGIFPNSKTIIEGNLEEERRLAYVGITRGKKRVFLSYNLSQHVSKNMFGPSRFLFNLPKNSIEFNVF